MSIRICTFNMENLFARYQFKKNQDVLADDGFTINQLAFSIFDETEKQITGAAIKEVDADIICLQEVENLNVLDRFNSRYLAGMKYKHKMVIDSHDPRFIDVAVLSRYPFKSVKTHRDERNKNNTAFLFSRDFLEVEVEVEGKIIFLYVNHFKSMTEGRAVTKERREEQAKRAAEIVNEYWKDKEYEGNFVVLGDLNDYPQGDTALKSLLNNEALENVIDRLPEKERWTHFWAGGNEYRQLDYIFLSKSLAAGNANQPGIMRRGLPYRAEKYTGPRFENVGENTPKASDHAPLYMDIDL